MMLATVPGERINRPELGASVLGPYARFGRLILPYILVELLVSQRGAR